MKRLYLFTTLLLILFAGSISTFAQNPAVLTIAMPELIGTLPPDLFTDFENQYGVRVVPIESLTEPYLPAPAYGVEAHLDALEAYLQSADVVYVNQYTLRPAGTQSGWYLNLAPLANTDPQLFPEDYAAVAWNSFRWDGGLWAFPFSYDTLTWAYNPTAFDEAGLVYPDSSWTLQQFADAARALTQRDAEGNVIRAGFEAYDLPTSLIVALANVPTLVDDTQFPGAPSLDYAELATVLQTWAQLQSEGSVGSPQSSLAGTVESMRLFYSFEHASNRQAGASLLPGGIAGVEVDGYAVSGGTSNPELAYQLAKYITQHADQFPFNIATYNAYTPINTPPEFSPQAEPVLDSALSVAIPYAPYRFADYLEMALGGDAALLQSLEISAQDAMTAAQARGSETSLFVEVPPGFSGDGVALRFGVQAMVFPLPNEEQWNDAIESFVSAEDEVAGITLEGLFGPPEQQQIDCFVSGNQTASMDVSTILPLNPLMDTDPNFAPEDFFAGTLDQTQRNGQTYGYPIALVPRMFTVDPAAFENVGVFTPAETWSVDEFIDAMNEISGGTGQPAYSMSRSLDAMVLIAAYGGLPLDYSTQPPSANFTDPASVQAIRQVLDLVSSGAASYTALADPQGMGTITGEPVRLYTLPSGGVGEYDPAQSLVNFPFGTQFVPVSYTVITGQVSAATPYPEACYRWLDFLSHRPEVYTTLPARRSELNRAEAEGLLAPELVSFLRSYESVLNQPNAVMLPFAIPRGESDTAVLQFWLNRAFDRYVLDGMDLDSELQLAQSNAEAYLSCRANGTSIQECALAIDPETSVVFQ